MKVITVKKKSICRLSKNDEEEVEVDYDNSEDDLSSVLGRTLEVGAVLQPVPGSQPDATGAGASWKSSCKSLA
mgnify:CR=1 FL=1